MKYLILMGLMVPFCLLSKSIEVQGHRGVRSLTPENTLPSFQLAIELGVDVIELDVLATKDEALIVHHDFFLKREICPDQPLIRSLSLKEVKQFDYGVRINPDFPEQLVILGTKIPTLEELFHLIDSSSHPHAKKIRLNIEVKRDPRHPELTMSAPVYADKLVELVKRKGFSERVYYSSFDPEVLFYIRKADPSAKIGFIFSKEILAAINQFDSKKGKELLIKLATYLKVETISPEHVLLKDKESVRSFQEKGFRVVPWTVNAQERWEELIKMGVDGVITDYPHELLKYLESLDP